MSDHIDLKAAMPVRVRPFIMRYDGVDFTRIENESFNDPWTPKDARNYLTSTFRRGYVACDTMGKVVGVLMCHFHIDHIEIHNMAVAADARRCGVGRQMILFLAAKLRPAAKGKRSFLSVKCVDYCLDAHLFFRSCGFRATEVIRDEPTKGIDAYRFDLHHHQCGKESKCSYLQEKRTKKLS